MRCKTEELFLYGSLIKKYTNRSRDYNARFTATHRTVRLRNYLKLITKTRRYETRHRKKMNVQHRTSNVQHRMKNEYPIPNIQRLFLFPHLFSRLSFPIQRSMFDVHLLAVHQSIQRLLFRVFGISYFRDNPFLFRVLHNLTCNRTRSKFFIPGFVQELT